MTRLRMCLTSVLGNPPPSPSHRPLLRALGTQKSWSRVTRVGRLSEEKNTWTDEPSKFGHTKVRGTRAVLEAGQQLSLGLWLDPNVQGGKAWENSK
jgi:hypothetical protein